MTSSGLLGSTTLEVAIGLIFVYLLLAVICTTVNEWIAGILKRRSTTLQGAIRQMLDAQAGQSNLGDANWFLQQFYAHPLISGLTQPGTKLHPAYISARTFATAVMDIATPQQPGVLNFAELETGIQNLPPGDVKKTLLSLIQNTNHDLCQAQKNIEDWYNDTMERVSGWYKRRTQLWTACLAIMLTLAANADTVQIAKTLWTDPTLRSELVEEAKQRTEANHQRTAAGDESKTTVAGSENNANSAAVQSSAKAAEVSSASRDELNTLGLVVGWNHQSLPTSTRGWLDKILGFFLSIVAISLGAPFWFDLLNRFMRVRDVGDSPPKK